MSCSTAKIFYGLKEAQIASSNGEGTITQSDRTQPSDIDHPRHKRSTRS